MEIWKPLKSILIEKYFVEYVFFLFSLSREYILFAVECILLGAYFDQNVISALGDSITGFLHAKSFKLNVSKQFPFVFQAIYANNARKMLNIIYEKFMRLNKFLHVYCANVSLNS